ncbi:MAG: GGDEF domain-containing protein [Rubrivivax sp.]
MNALLAIDAPSRFPTAIELAQASGADLKPGDDPAACARRAWALRQYDSYRAAEFARAVLVAPSAADTEPWRGYAELVLAEIHWLFGDADRARKHADRARALLETCGCGGGVSDVHWLVSHLASDASDLKARDAAMHASLACAIEAADQSRVRTCQLALACFRLYDEDTSLEAGVVLAESLLEAQDAGVRMMALTFMVRYCFTHDMSARAVQLCLAAREIAAACGQYRRSILDGCNIAEYLLDTQETDEALRQLQELVSLARRCGWPHPLARALAGMAHALLRLDRLDMAREMALEAMSCVGTAKRSRTYFIAANTLGQVELQIGNADGAARRFAELLDFARDSGDLHLKRWALVGLAQVYAHQHEWLQAYLVADDALGLARSASDTLVQVTLLRLQAQVARKLRDQNSSEFHDTIETPESLLTAAAAAAERAGAIQGHDELLVELSIMREEQQDLEGALRAARSACDALLALRSRDVHNRAVGMEVRFRTEQALAAVATQRRIAEAEAARSAELQAMNRQLQGALAEIERTQAALLAKNEELSKAYSEISELSLTDPLTGLRNRRFLSQVIDHCVAEALRSYRRETFSGEARKDPLDVIFFMVDLDHFKAVNDTHGHSAGDAVLVQMRDRLRMVAREEDYLIRWGGEEFLIAMRGTPRKHAPAIAQRLLRAVSSSDFIVANGTKLQKTCSIGYCAFPIEAERPLEGTWQQAVDLADARLYEAKRAGRNRAQGPA